MPKFTLSPDICVKCKRSFPRTIEFFPPQKKAHDGLRHTCRECWRAENRARLATPEGKAQKAAARKRRDPAIVAAEKKRSHERCRDKDNARSLKWYYDHMEYSRQQKREYYLAHRDEILERVHQRYLRKCAEIKAYIHHWQQCNRDKVRCYAANHRRKLGMSVRPPVYFHTERRRVRKQLIRARAMGLEATLTFDQWEHCLDYFDNHCAVCGRPKGFFHTIGLDHWIPLEHGGGTTADNVLPLCCGYDGCNNMKSHTDPHIWLLSHFGAHEASQIESRIALYFDSITKQA